MSCGGCVRRLESRLLPFLGYRKTDRDYRWRRKTSRGIVTLEMNPAHHFRAALLALVARALA